MKIFTKFTFAISLLSVLSTVAQEGIGTNNPDPSSALDVTSTTQGILIPRMTTAQRTTIASPAEGLRVYDTDTKDFWFFDGTIWVRESIAAGEWEDDGAGGIRAKQAFANGKNVVVTDEGTVGIGTATPANRAGVHVYDENRSARIHLEGVDDLGVGESAGVAFYAPGEQAYATIAGLNTGVGTGDLRFLTDDGTAHTERMIIKSTGEIGLGTNTPEQKLDIAAGNIHLDNNFGIGANFNANAEAIIYPHYSGFQSLNGLGPTMTNNAGILLMADAQISFAESDNQKVVGSMNVNNEEFDWDGRITTDGLSHTFNTKNNELKFLANDGTGNMHMYWNSTGGTAPTALEAGNAYDFTYNAAASGNLTLRVAPSVAAGDAQSFSAGMTWLGNGNVGIGTANPATKLNIVANGGAVTRLEAGGTDNWAELDLKSSHNVLNEKYWNIAASGGDGTFRIRTLDDDRTNSATQFLINRNGNVGIGTTSPNEKLEVNGKVRVSDLSGAAAATDVIVTADATTGELKNGGTLASLNNNPWDNPDGSVATQLSSNINFMNGNVAIGNQNDNNHLLSVSGEVRIDTGTGDLNNRSVGLGVGYTPNDVYTPNSDPTDARRGFSLFTNTQDYPVVMTMRNLRNGWWDFIFDPNDSDQLHFRHNSRTTPVLTLDNSGNVGMGTTTPTSRLDVVGQRGIYLSHNGSADSGFGFIGSPNNMHIAQNAYYDGTWKALGNASGKAVLNRTGLGSDIAFMSQVDNSGGLAADDPISWGTVFSVRTNGNLRAHGDIMASDGFTSVGTERNPVVTVFSDRAFGMELHSGQAGSGHSGGWATAVYGRNQGATSLRFGSYNGNATAQEDFIEMMTLQNDGDFGVGVVDPTEKLDVDGTARLRGLVDDNDPANKVVVADATGVLKTVAAGDLASGEWEDDGAGGIRAKQAFANGDAVTITDNGNLRIFADEATLELGSPESAISFAFTNESMPLTTATDALWNNQAFYKNTGIVVDRAGSNVDRYQGSSTELFIDAINTRDFDLLRGISSWVRDDSGVAIGTINATNAQATKTGAGSVATLRGVLGTAQNTGTATVTNLVGLSTWMQNTGGGTVTNAMGLHIPRSLGQNTVTNDYGLKIDNRWGGTDNNYGLFIQNATGATNNYAIYTGGGDIRFGGLQDNNDPNDKVMVTDANGVLHQISKADLASETNNNPWDNPDGSVADQGSTDINYMGGNVGIGTANPTDNLEVIGQIKSTGTIPRFRMFETDGNTDENFQLGMRNGTFLIQSNNDAFDAGADLVSVEQSGYMGVGTSTPEYRLEVEGAGTGILIHETGTTSNNSQFTMTKETFSADNKSFQIHQQSTTDRTRFRALNDDGSAKYEFQSFDHTNGHMSMGAITNPAESYLLQTRHIADDGLNTQGGIETQLFNEFSGSLTNSIAESNLNYLRSGFTGAINAFEGSRDRLFLNSGSSGTIANARISYSIGSVEGNDPTSSTTAITNLYGHQIAVSSLDDKSENAYGLYVGNVQDASSLNYAIYTNAGDIRFGDLQDDSNPANKVVVADTNGVLKTIASGDLAAGEWEDDGAGGIRSKQAFANGRTMTVTDSGKFLIGKDMETYPNVYLEIEGDAADTRGTAVLIKDNEADQGAQLQMRNDVGTGLLVSVSGSASTTPNRTTISGLNGMTGGIYLSQPNGADNALSYTQGVQQRLFMQPSTGNLAIGNSTSPTNKLHVVSGSDPVRFQGLQDDNTATNKFVVADANGVLKTADLSQFPESAPIRVETADYSVTDADGTILVDASTGDVTVTLPAPVLGRKIVVKKIDSSVNSVIIDGAGATIDGVASRTTDVPFQAFVLHTEGTGWYIIN